MSILISYAMSDLPTSASSVLQDLSLPASLEALDRHIGIPPSLLRKCQEVQLEDGIRRIEQSIENAENFSQYCRDALNEVESLCFCVQMTS